jgi:small subunit ribosomal protein S1
VLDIDRDRQRISLGLKQTQEDPWQRVVNTHRSGDVLEGTVTKVVAFGAFVEILPGVEGLVHISELADHHVENPSEVVEPGAKLNVKILEIDEERRRLSLSIKRVEGQNMPMGDLGAQIAEAEGSSESAAGPVAEDDASSSQAAGDVPSSQAAGDVPSSTPPADESSEVDEPQDEALEEEQPQDEVTAEEPDASEQPQDEPAAEEPVAESPSEEASEEELPAEPEAAEEPEAEAESPAEDPSDS